MNFVETVIASSIGFLFATFVGGWVTSRMNHAGALEAERDQDVDSVRKVALELRDLGVAYWSFDRDNLKTPDADEAAIVGRVTFIAQISDELFRSEKYLQDDIFHAINEFDEALTGDSFQSHGRAADPSRASAIEVTCYTLVSKAGKCRRRLKPSWLRIWRN